MADARRAATARKNIDDIERSRRMYVEGNAARRLQEMPARREYPNTVYPQTKRHIAAVTTTQPVQHRQNQGADLEAVHIGVGTDNDLAPAEIVNIKGGQLL